MILVASRTSKSNFSAKASSKSCRPELPLGVVAGLDGVPEVAAVEVGVGPVDLDRLVPDDRLQALLRLPVELDEGRLPLGVDQAEGVDAEALHEPERARDRPVGHDPHDHVHALGRERDEVPEVVVGGLRLREAPVRLRLGGVDQVGELDRVLDEEDGDVVADEVPVPLLGVELHGEAADVAGEVGRALAAGDGREADEDGRLLALALEEVGPGDVGERLVVLEVAVGAVAAGVDDPLGDALVVEVEDLLAEVEVFQERRAAGTGPERVLVVGDGDALLGGQHRRIAAGRLVGLAAAADGDLGVRLACGLACVVLPLGHVRNPCPCWNFCSDSWTEAGPCDANVIPGWTTESVFSFRFEARWILVYESARSLPPGESPAYEEKPTDVVRGRAGSSPQDTARGETSPIAPDQAGSPFAGAIDSFRLGPYARA